MIHIRISSTPYSILIFRVRKKSIDESNVWGYRVVFCFQITQGIQKNKKSPFNKFKKVFIKSLFFYKGI